MNQSEMTSKDKYEILVGKSRRVNIVSFWDVLRFICLIWLGLARNIERKNLKIGQFSLQILDINNNLFSKFSRDPSRGEYHMTTITFQKLGRKFFQLKTRYKSGLDIRCQKFKWA